MVTMERKKKKNPSVDEGGIVLRGGKTREHMTAVSQDLQEKEGEK